jgi:membrane-bound lytic murein transglycosylase MltF
MHQESSFKTPRDVIQRCAGIDAVDAADGRRFGVRNIWDPQQNIEGGARYMRFLLDLFGDDVSSRLRATTLVKVQ